MAAAAESKKLNGAPVLIESVIREAEREAVATTDCISINNICKS